MSKTWFRFHVSALDKAKIQKLPGNLHKQWVNVLCIGTKADLPDGRLPSLEDVAHQLHLSETKASVILSDLHVRKLLDYEDGWYRIHDWNEYQYTKDVSTERVKRFRERSKKHSETPTLPARDARDASESVSVSVSSLEGKGSAEGEPNWKHQAFEEFWKVVWAKIGRGAAEKAYRKAAKTEGTAERINAATVAQGPRLVQDAERNGRSVIHPATWLNQGRYDDEPIDGNLFGQPKRVYLDDDGQEVPPEMEPQFLAGCARQGVEPKWRTA